MRLSIRVEFHVYITHLQGCKAKEKSEPTSSNKRFLQAAMQEAERLRNALSPSTVKNYMTAIRSFGEYLGRDIPISDVQQQTMKGFERWLRERNVCLNTISCYMRSLRSVFMKLNGGKGSDVFSVVYRGRSKTEKRAIQESDVAKIKMLDLKANSFASLSRDLFLFSFYALGMPFVDMAFLRKSQISNNQIVYHRHKTGQRISIRLEPCMLEIINRYQSIDREYVFPILHSEDNVKAYNEYTYMLNRYNKTLKSIASKSGIKSCLTSYTPRHSWASVAFSNNVELPVISKALGHTNPQTTLTYIRQINDTRLEKANKAILEKLK